MTMMFPVHFWLVWQLSMRAMFNPFPAPKKAKPQEAKND
jgi:hypothetical protein